MRVQIFSDIHSDLAALETNAKVDADLGDKLWVIPGNHETDADITAFCEKFGFHDFHGKSFEQGGWRFAGLGYSSPTPFNTPGEYSEDEIAEKLAAFASLDPLVLVCHAPPAGTALDAAGPGKHFGSQAVAKFLDAQAPAHFFCGHVHEAAGQELTLGSTKARNVGKRGYLLEL